MRREYAGSHGQGVGGEQRPNRGPETLLALVGHPNNRDISREKWTNTASERALSLSPSPSLSLSLSSLFPSSRSRFPSERHALRLCSSISALDYIRQFGGRRCSKCISTRVKSLRGLRIYLWLCCKRYQPVEDRQRMQRADNTKRNKSSKR